MRIEIDTPCQYRRTITTRSASIAGDWFAEQARDLMSANSQIGDCRLRIWPDTMEESKTIGQHADIQLDQDGLLHFAKVILMASERLAEAG